MHLPNIPNISKISFFVDSCVGRCSGLREVGQWMWSVIWIPPCLRGIVDYLGVAFPGLCHSVPVLFARETWSGWGGTQWRLSVCLPLPCGGSYFTSSHFLFLFWFGRGTVQQSYGPDTWLHSREVVREGGRASSLGPPEGFSCS